MRERCTALHMPVADEPEIIVLRKDAGFVVNGAVFEVEDAARNKLVPLDDLGEVACRNRLALHGSQYEKSVDCSLHVAYGYRFRQRADVKQRNGGQAQINQISEA
jgi:hypothetical protein